MEITEPGFVAVVDDDASTLSALWRLLVANRYRVRTFSTAEQLVLGPGLDHVRCVVTDINLGGGMSGLELGEALFAAGRNIPLILMTGSADDELRDRARALGCVALLDKPFPIEQLLEALAKAIARGAS